MQPYFHLAERQATQCCSSHSPVSVNLKPGNYIETRDPKDYNILEVRRLMLMRSSTSCSSRKARNRGATLRYRRTSPVIRSKPSGVNEYSDPAFLLSMSKTSSEGDK